MNKKWQFIIIIVEIIILLGLSGYRMYEYLNKDKEEVKENENNSKIEDEKDNISNEDKTKKEIRVLVDQINIRKEANENSEDIGDVLLDETYDVLEVVDSDNYTWYKINKNGVIGYIANQKGQNWIEYIDSNVEILDINSDLVKNLVSPFDYNVFFSTYAENNFIKDDFDVESASNNQLLAIVFNYFFSDPSVNKSDLLDENIENYYANYYSVSSILFKNYFNKIFGLDKNFKYENVGVDPFGKCNTCDCNYLEEKVDLNYTNPYNQAFITYDNKKNTFNCPVLMGGCIISPYSCTTSNNVIKFKAQMANDNIIVEYFVFGMLQNPVNNSCSIYNIHNEEKIEEIKETKCRENNANNEIFQVVEDEIENLKHQNKLPIYKATFKKQSDGNYYFSKGEWQ